MAREVRMEVKASEGVEESTLRQQLQQQQRHLVQSTSMVAAVAEEGAKPGRAPRKWAHAVRWALETSHEKLGERVRGL